jgi:hypothetical protein
MDLAHHCDVSLSFLFVKKNHVVYCYVSFIDLIFFSNFPFSDCFERIALGAMLPFEKTFRNSDTNSLRICENICMMDKKCNTFSFG